MAFTKFSTQKEEEEEKRKKTLLVPAPLPFVSPLKKLMDSLPKPAPLPPSYTVKPNDNLWDITEKIGGNPELWPKLYEENKQIIGSNPDLILPKQTLNLAPILPSKLNVGPRINLLPKPLLPTPKLTVPPLPARPAGWNHDPLAGENPNTPALIANAGYGLSRGIDKFFNLPFNQRATKTGQEVITGQQIENIPSTGSKGADLTADLLGNVAGFGVNPGSSLNLGKAAFGLGENALKKTLPQLLKKPAPTLGKEALGVLGGTVAFEGLNKATSGEPFNPKEFALTAGANTALGLLPLGIGKAIDIHSAPGWSNLGELSNFLVKNKPIEAPKLETPLPLGKGFGPLKVKTPEQMAYQNYLDGVETVRNHIRHDDILSAFPTGTTLDQAFASIKKDTGIDLPLLAQRYEAASLKPQGLVNKFTPERAQMARAAGITPERRDTRFVIPDFSKVQSKPLIPLPQVAKTAATNIEIPQLKPMKFPLSPFPQVNQEVAATKLGQNPFNPLQTPKIELPRLTDVKDIGHFEAYSKDVYRIFRKAMGKDAGEEFLLPFDQAKTANIDMQNELLNGLKKNVVDRLGISKGSKESAMVQLYGEGKLTLDELKLESPDKWRNVVEADKWFRTQYNSLIDRVNAAKKEIYPNAEARVSEIQGKINKVQTSNLSRTEKNEVLAGLNKDLESAMRGKIVPKRPDYYRHWQEMKEGLGALKNIFDSPAQINTELIGTSEWTSPKSKWASAWQKRTGDKTVYDAVGGFLDYAPQAAYATHIDPQIPRFRNLEKELKAGTADTHNADRFIGFLDKFADDLSGKTNPIDRTIQDAIPGGRKTFKALGWLNNRIKGNLVLGKASSALSQLANVPAGMAYAKEYSAHGLARSVASIVQDNPAMKQSGFLKERFGGAGSKIYRQFDESLLNKPKDMAVWLMETADRVGTTFIWNSAYSKALAEKVSDPIRTADMATRDLIAGRGIGEVPLVHKSQIMQLIMPFQLEVANLWHIQKDMVSKKDFGGLVALYLLNRAFNEGMEQVKGSGVVFDPVGAAWDAAHEENTTPGQKAGRVIGEVAANTPMAQSLIDVFYPEYGTNVLPSRKEIFGKNDPTRFGSSVLIAKGLQDPLAKIIPPFGGEQISKTLQGARDLVNKGHFEKPNLQDLLKGNLNPKTKLSYPVEPNVPNQIKGLLFGPSATSEAQKYYEKNRRPLTETQTKDVLKSSNPQELYVKIMIKRALDTIDSKIKEVSKDPKLTKEEKYIQTNVLKLQRAKVQQGK